MDNEQLDSIVHQIKEITENLNVLMDKESNKYITLKERGIVLINLFHSTDKDFPFVDDAINNFKFACIRFEHLSNNLK